MNQPKVSIITPVYNMLPFLKQCAASVNDQGENIEHIIVDGDSSDGTKEWLEQLKGARWISEKDRGMYDALNKGLFMAKGKIIGHLNADEQYLPGTLQYINDFFENHPAIDFVVADFLLVDKKGELVAFRKSFPLFWPFFFSNYLYAYTCTLFYRNKVVQKVKYDSTLQSIADVDFIYRIIKSGFKGAHISKYVAAYTHTGHNLSESPLSFAERINYERQHIPSWFKIAKPFLKLFFFGTRVAYKTIWHRGNLEYEIYTSENLRNRKKITVERPSYKWIAQ